MTPDQNSNATLVTDDRSASVMVSVIIVNWNAREYLLQCLASLSSEVCRYAMEIIVVDNDSSDGSPEAVEAQFPHVRLFRSGGNLGFAKANNLGVSHSRGRYVAFINSDVKVLKGCLTTLVDYCDQHPEIGMAGPRVIGGDGKLQRSCRGFPTVWNMFCRALVLDAMFPRVKLFSGYAMTYWPQDTPRPVDMLSGCFWLVRREALNEVGLLDEAFFMYGEDMDWCKRFWAGGWKVTFVPSAEAIHYGGASSANAPVRFYIERQRADLQYWKKHHTWSGGRVLFCHLLRAPGPAQPRLRRCARCSRGGTVKRIPTRSAGVLPVCAGCFPVAFPPPPRPDFLSMQAKYILLTAAKNEETYIGETIASVLRQTVRPVAWFIIDDGSTDRTAEVVASFATKHPFIRLQSAGSRSGRNFGAKDTAIRAAYEMARPLDFDFVSVHDADIAPEKDDYYETMLGEFAKNPRLGIAGGFIFERQNGVWRERPGNSVDSVAGGSQMFRRRCFEEIGGYTPLYHGGADWLVQIEAKMAGWDLIARRDHPLLHYRPTSQSGTCAGCFQAGQMDASFGSHPIFEAVKCARRVAMKPILLGSLFRFSG